MAVISKNLGTYVSEMINSDKQIQMCGVELTVRDISDIMTVGKIGFSNEDRELPLLRIKAFPVYGPAQDWIWLDPGAYLVTFNEIVEIPPDVMAIARPRSSLIRMGATIETAVWDPGYKGRSQSLLIVYNPEGIKIKRNARLMQLIFFRLEDDAEKLYNGIYQKENIKNDLSSSLW